MRFGAAIPRWFKVTSPSLMVLRDHGSAEGPRTFAAATLELPTSCRNVSRRTIRLGEVTLNPARMAAPKQHGYGRPAI